MRKVTTVRPPRRRRTPKKVENDVDDTPTDNHRTEHRKKDVRTFQHVVWPWEGPQWPAIRSKLTDPIPNVVELDSRIASLRSAKTRPRLLHEMFDAYYSCDDYINVRPSMEFFFGKILPMLQKLVLDAPKTFKGFSGRLLLPQQNTNITITRIQAATIVAGIWFGLFDYDYVSPGRIKINEFSEPTFMYAIESANTTVFQFLISYFTRLYYYISDDDTPLVSLKPGTVAPGGIAIDKSRFHSGSIIIKRNVINAKPDWENIMDPIIDPAVGEGHPDDSYALMHTAYAHQFIGGDMFKASLTQEELLLLIRPECLACLIFCARLDPNESISVFGAEKVSQYNGIGSSIRFLEPYYDTTPAGITRNISIIRNCVVFIDATQKSSSGSQMVDDFDRDLAKAYCGMMSIDSTDKEISIACGNWAYGFNGSHMQVKFIQLLLASSLAKKTLEYYPIGRDFETELLPFIDWVQREELTISDLYGMYIDLIGSLPKNSRLGDLNVFESIMDM